MRVMCNALTDEHSTVSWLVFDWCPSLQRFAEECQQLIKANKLLKQSDFLHLSFVNFGCTAIESIDEGEACDGLIQAKWKLENGRLEFVYLDDNISLARGVTEGRLGVGIVLVDAKHLVWNLYIKHQEDSLVESPPFTIPVSNATSSSPP
jgi:hypothetical protein